MKRTFLPLLLGLVLSLLIAGCGGDVVDAGPVSSTGQDGADDASGADGTEQPDDTAEDANAGDADGDAGDDDAGDDDADADADADDADDVDDHGEVDTTTVRLYYLAPDGGTPARAGPFLVSVQREIPSVPGIALATLRELVEGPADPDQQTIDDISTAVPAETLVLDVAIDDGLATVNLSREFESGGGSFSMLGRLAQIVYTMTQFPTVDEVQFQLDGEAVTVFSGEGIVLDGPVSRDDYLDLLPTVFVDTPSAGADVEDPIRVTGMAMVFEATFQYRLEAADGEVLAEGHTMSDNGVGWGAFDFTVPFEVDEVQEGTLTVFEYSAQDGSVQAERSTPVVLAP